MKLYITKLTLLFSILLVSCNSNEDSNQSNSVAHFSGFIFNNGAKQVLSNISTAIKAKGISVSSHNRGPLFNVGGFEEILTLGNGKKMSIPLFSIMAEEHSSGEQLIGITLPNYKKLSTKKKRVYDLLVNETFKAITQDETTKWNQLIKQINKEVPISLEGYNFKGPALNKYNGYLRLFGDSGLSLTFNNTKRY